MEKKESDLRSEINRLMSRIAGILALALLFVFPIYVEDRYANILRAKYRFYYLCVLIALGLVLILALVFAFIDFLEYRGNHVKAYFTRLTPKNWKNNFTLYEGALICFMLAAVISALQSEYFYESVWGNEGRYSGTFLLLVYGVSVLLIGRLLRFKQWYLEAFLVSSLLVCLFGITDYFRLDVMGFKKGLAWGASDIFTSTFGNINTYTAFAALPIGVAAVLYTMADTTKKAAWYYICTIIFLTAGITGQSDNIYLTLAVVFGFLPFYAFGTKKGIRRYVLLLAALFTVIRVLGFVDMAMKGPDRGQVIGLGGPARMLGYFSGTTAIAAALWLMAAGIYWWERKKSQTCHVGKWPRRLWGGFVISVIAVILGVLYDANVAGNSARYGALSNYVIFNDSWGTDRGFAWRFAMELYDRFPLMHKLFGYGPDTFGILTTRYTGSTAAKMYEELGVIYDSVHNAYLQYLVTIGSIGLTVYMLFLTSAITWMVRTARKSPAVMACVFAVACYCGQAVVNIDLPAVTPAFWTILAVGAAAVRAETEKTGA
ncbi:O-antigen ligase family protein [Lachnospiraceae bacterium 62-35]